MVYFRLFSFVSKQFVSVVSLLNQNWEVNWNRQKTKRNSLIKSIFWYLSENFGLFWYVLKQFCLFRYRFETLKQPETNPIFFVFGFTKQTETQPKHIFFRFVLVQTKNFLFLFRGHPSSGTWKNQDNSNSYCANIFLLPTTAFILQRYWLMRK